MLGLVSPHTQAITGQLAGSQMKSNSLTHGGLINLEVTVVELWKEDQWEVLGVGNRWNGGGERVAQIYRWMRRDKM